MSSSNWSAQFSDGNIQVNSERLAEFRKLYVGDTEISDRISELILFDMYIMDQKFGVNPRSILKSIKDLEAEEYSQGIKPAAPFNKLPLKGLWHKHFFSAHFLASNILLGLGKTGLEKLVTNVIDPSKSTPEMINEMADRVTHEPLESRRSLGKLTGEWIIFIKQEGKNYYLSINTHDAGDTFIYDRILEHCVRDFPQLLDWIESLRSA
jgi:hypothetical protein